MKDFKYNRGLVLVIIVGLIAAIMISFARHDVEEANRQIDLATNYEDLLELADREGLPADEVLSKAKEAGITSLAVYDTTFKKLNANGKATAIAGSEILANYHSGALSDPMWRQLVADGKIQGNEIYIVGHDARTWKELKEDVPRRLGKERVEPERRCAPPFRQGARGAFAGRQRRSDGGQGPFRVLREDGYRYAHG